MDRLLKWSKSLNSEMAFAGSSYLSTRDMLEQIYNQRETRLAYRGIHVPEEDLFLDGEGEDTDVVVTCQGQTWKAHQLILKTRCEFFRKCLRNDFQESNSGPIVLDDDNPDACEIFLRFLYTRHLFNLPKIQKSEEDSYSSHTDMDLVLIAELCSMGHKYNVGALVLAIADLFCPGPGPFDLKSNTHNELLTFLVAIQPFRDMAEFRILEDHLIRNLTYRHEEMVDDDSLDLLLTEYPGIVLKLCRPKYHHSKPSENPFCSKCGTPFTYINDVSKRELNHCVNCNPGDNHRRTGSW